MNEHTQKGTGPTWLLWAGFIVLVAVATLFALSVMPQGGSGMMSYGGYSGGTMMGSWGGSWWVMLFPMLFALVFLVILVALIVFAVSTPAPTCAGAPVEIGGTSREIAERRYAAGELSREEYLCMQEDLAGKPGEAK